MLNLVFSEKLEKKTDVIMMILYTIISPAAIKFFKRSFGSNSNIFTGIRKFLLV